MDKDKPSSNLSAEIYSVLKNRIIRWEYMPDHRFTEISLCEEFNVSRSPIREVLQMLEEKGLVTKEPKLGYTVKQPNMQEVFEFYEYRLALEQYVAEVLASQGMNEEIWLRLHQQWSQILSDIPQVDESFAELDENFHTSLALAAGNKFLLKQLVDINERLHFIRINDITSVARLVLTSQQHLDILRCIKSRQVELARQAMKNNIEGGRMHVNIAVKEALSQAYLRNRNSV